MSLSRESRSEAWRFYFIAVKAGMSSSGGVSRAQCGGAVFWVDSACRLESRSTRAAALGVRMIGGGRRQSARRKVCISSLVART